MICKHDWKDIKTICCNHKQCSVCGVIKKVGICDYHKPKTNTYEDKEYYMRKDLKLFVDCIPMNGNNCASYQQNFVKMKVDFPERNTSVLEIGAGTGKIVPLFLKKGCDYEAIEVGDWTSKYLSGCFGVTVHHLKFEDFVSTKKYDNVVCIHTLEHFADADLMFEKIVNLTKDNGKIFIEIPNQEDLYNPDHYWFMSADTIRNWAKLNGLKELGFLVKRVNSREDFMYFIFEKKGGLF